VLPVPGPLRLHLGGGSGKRGLGAMRVCGFLRRSAGTPPSLVMATPQVATIVNANQAFEKNLFASVRKPKTVSIRG
jgi:hypothetical protein